MRRIACLFIVAVSSTFFIGSCASTKSGVEVGAVRIELTQALSASINAPEECGFSLGVDSERLSRISKHIEILGSGGSYGIYARLGGAYIYSNYILVIPERGRRFESASTEDVLVISSEAYEELFNRLRNGDGSNNSPPLNLHDECELMWFLHDGGQIGRVFMASQVSGLDSIEPSEMTRSFDQVKKWLEINGGDWPAPTEPY